MSWPVSWRIGRIRIAAVAGGDVEIAVGAEVQRSAVVPAAEPGDHDLFAVRIDARRIADDAEARYARAVGQVRVARFAEHDVADIAVVVFGESGMERQAVGVADDGVFRQRADLLLECRETDRRSAILAIGKREDSPGLLDDKPSIARRRDDHFQRVLECQLGKHSRRHVRRGWFRRAGDSRRCPCWPRRAPGIGRNRFVR